MKIAAVRAIAELAQAEQSDIVAEAYGTDSSLSFGPDYLIPRPFDPRLILKIAPAVAKAAVASGVATRPLTDWDAYEQELKQFVYQSGFVMKPLFSAARHAPKRVVYAEGEEEKVLRAVQIVVDEKLARPILIGRPDVINTRIARLGLRIQEGRDFEMVNTESDPRYREYWQLYHQVMERDGVSVEYAKLEMRRRPTKCCPVATIASSRWRCGRPARARRAT